MKRMALLFSMTLAFLSASAQAGLITVGDENCEYTNINEAIEASDPGDIIEVQSQVYHENVIVNKSITLRGLETSGKKPVVDAKGDESAMVLDAGSIQIEGFVLKNSGFGKAGIEVRSDDNLVRNNEIVENRWYGILIDSNNNKIQNNTVRNNRYGIWITFNTAKNVISGNDFEDNQIRNVTDLGTNWWNMNLYGDFNGQDVYKIPGGQNLDENPLSPMRNVAEHNHAAEESLKGASEKINLVEGDGSSIVLTVATDLASGNEGDMSGEVGTVPEEVEEKSHQTSPDMSDSLVLDEDDDLKLENVDDTHPLELGSGQKRSGVNETPEGLGSVERVQEVDKEPSDEVRTATYWLEGGDYLMDHGRYESAIKYYDYVISIDSELAEAWNKKGNALKNLGRYEGAIRCYDKAIRTKTDLASAWCNKGNVLQMLGSFEDALDCYDRATNIDPEFGVAWNNKGMTLNRLGRYPEALRSFENAIEIDSECTAAWRNKSWALQMTGHDEEAKAAFELAQILEQG